MVRQKDGAQNFPRRTFLRSMRWAPVLLLPAPIRVYPFGPENSSVWGERSADLPFADFRLTPHYPTKSPFEDVLRHVVPGGDEFVTEKYAAKIAQLLGGWAQALKSTPPALAVVAKFLDASIEANSFTPVQESVVRSGNGIEVFRRRFSKNVASGRERFLQEIRTYFAQMGRVETAEFEIVEIQETASSPLTVHPVDRRRRARLDPSRAVSGIQKMVHGFYTGRKY